MKQSLFLRARELFLGSDIVRKYSFRMIDARDNCAYFQEHDCFECLSPHEIAV